MTESDATAIPPARDDEHALRLVVRDWFKDGKLTSAAFHTRSRSSPRYVSISMFVEERLPGADGSVLHAGRFANRDRVRLDVGSIRSVTYMSGGTETPAGFDLLMDGHAESPLEAYSEAHAELQGPTPIRTAARALARAFDLHGQLEKAPD